MVANLFAYGRNVAVDRAFFDDDRHVTAVAAFDLGARNVDVAAVVGGFRRHGILIDDRRLHIR